MWSTDPEGTPTDPTPGTPARYTCTVELQEPFTADVAARALDVLTGYHPIPGCSSRGRATIALSLIARHPGAAQLAALGLVRLHQLGIPLAVRVRSDAHHDSVPSPHPATGTPTVAMAAEQVGVGRTATGQRIDAATLPAQPQGDRRTRPAPRCCDACGTRADH